MKFIRALTIAVLLSSWLTAPSVFAQGAGIEWDILNQEVMALYRSGNYGRAVVVAKKALYRRGISPRSILARKWQLRGLVLFHARMRRRVDA